MHLRSITMKGFKSFPDRTRLEFAEGVSVIVGPNGSGKSNVTDAVLWALGEQSPLAVRGQTMQDVIFSGGPGVPSRSAAEVEVVIDDSGFELGAEFAELSIARRLDRSGDGEYRLNGARCRLVDVLEALSDTGLGKEMHSVVSQGRVEAVIHSSPAERRLLIEEAAGLGKHRKRRRRAELKLARTGENLSRLLDVEREARSHLRPLKRRAEAAELHERLERQWLEERLELLRDDARGAAERLAAAESEARAARARHADAERRLGAVRVRREAAERAFADGARLREALSGQLFATTAAADRVEMRLERVRELAAAAGRVAGRLRDEHRRGAGAEATGGDGDRGAGQGLSLREATRDRIVRLEAELAALGAAGGKGGGHELGRPAADRERRERRSSELEDRVAERRGALRAVEAEAARAREERHAADDALATARSDSARAHADLEALDQLARRAAGVRGAAGALAEHLHVEAGYELALAAALGSLLRAGVAGGLGEASSALDAGGKDGGAVIIDRTPGGNPAAEPADRPAGPPVPGAERLIERVRPGPLAAPIAARLLAGTWVVDELESLPDAFEGTAVTRSGRALVTGTGELRQAAPGGDDRLLEQLSRREDLAAAAKLAADRLEKAGREAEDRARALSAAEAARDRAAEAVRAAVRELEHAAESALASEREALRREQAADAGVAIRRAELEAELRAERRIAQRAEREAANLARRRKRLIARAEREAAIERDAKAAAPVLAGALAALGSRREELREELADGEENSTRAGQELRACAREEAEVQAALREAGEVVTAAEVAAQGARDAAMEAGQRVEEVVERLGSGGHASQGPPAVPLSDDERRELRARAERLARRRERLGPVNPLAREEYEEATARVEELEAQRGDLETALAELEAVIAEADRRIRESFERTFEATARNFEEVVEELFPGGRGRLRLVTPEAPRPVLGGDAGESPSAEEGGKGPEHPPPGEAGTDHVPSRPAAHEPGVEVEVTPAGKSTRRLSLMSGGERSLVALAFLFAVFLSRPCPFYVLDEVEAALDDVNIDRFLRLVRRCARRAQFIVVTHQRRTMDAADRLYGVSMGSDGVSKVVSRRLPREAAELDGPAVEEAAA